MGDMFDREIDVAARFLAIPILSGEVKKAKRNTNQKVTLEPGCIGALFFEQCQNAILKFQKNLKKKSTCLYGCILHMCKF